jgi:hypothetical protein
MEQQRASWMKAMTHSESLAETVKRLVGEASLAAHVDKLTVHPQASLLAEQINQSVVGDYLTIQMTKQWRESQRAEEERLRRMLDPLQDIRKRLLEDVTTNRMLEELANPSVASERMAKLMGWATGSSALMQAMHPTIEGSIESTRNLLAEVSISSGIGHLMKSFEQGNKSWVVPPALLGALAPLQALQEQLGRLSLPVIDPASAVTLASLLGPEGIQAQLAALGINPDGSINVELIQQEEGIGLTRKSLDLMALLSFIFAILIPICQEINSSQWQESTEKALAAQTEKIDAQSIALEEQRMMIEALSKLVEKALAQEAKRQEERFVVLDRVTVVRSWPEHGAPVEGKLLPREVVRPISERGKWIEFEYFHWLHKEHRTGWALKKYFQRVPVTRDAPE